MYKLSFTVQKNPTKLFENGLIRFAEVKGLYVPLRFIVKQKESEKKVVNPTIQEVRFHLRGPKRIPKNGSSSLCRDVRAIAEFQVSRSVDSSKDYNDAEAAYRAFNSAAIDGGFEDSNGSSSCFTHFRVDIEEDENGKPTTSPLFHDSPLVQSLELTVGNAETIENLLRTLPHDGSRYATPMHACLINVSIAGYNVRGVEQAADKICTYFEKLQKNK